MRLFKRKTFTEKRIAQLENEILGCLRKAQADSKKGYVDNAILQRRYVTKLEEELELLQRDED